MRVEGTPHFWADAQAAWDEGRMSRWPAAKGEHSMAHYRAQDLPFLPYVGTVTTSPATDPGRYVAGFSHDHESASPGYYGVTLDSGATVELSATQRSGISRITYPISTTPTLLVNVSGSIGGVSDAQVDIGTNTISGWATRACTGSASAS